MNCYQQYLEQAASQNHPVNLYQALKVIRALGGDWDALMVDVPARPKDHIYPYADYILAVDLLEWLRRTGRLQ